MKKWLMAVSAAAVTTALVAGCGTSGNSTNGTSTSNGTSDSGVSASDVKGSITVLTNRTDLQQNGTLQQYANEFKKEYPGVTSVNFQAITNYAQDVKVRLSSGNAGDVLLIPTTVQTNQFPEFFAPLDNLGLDNTTYFGTYDSYQGKTYGLASGINVNGLIYNKQVFQKAGISAPPKTLNEFYADCAKIKAMGVTPIALNYTAGWTLSVWDQLSQPIANDPNYFNEWVGKKDPFQASSPVGQALNIAYTIVQKGYAEPNFKVTDWETSKSNFSSGKVAMMPLGQWAIPQFESKGISSANIGFVPFPYDNSGKLNALMGPDYFYAVSKNSQNIPTAEAFVKFMVEKSQYAQTQGFIPPVKTQQPQLPQLQQFESSGATMLQAAAPSASVTAIENAAQIDIGGGQYMQSVLTAPTFSAALAKLNQEWDNGLQEAGQ